MFDDDSLEILKEITSYVCRRIATTIRQKRIAILEKRLGAANVCETQIIFVRMLKYEGKYHKESHMAGVVALRSKFNHAVNDVAAKIDQLILTVNSCNSYEHFDKGGKLSIAEKKAFWYEIDDLIDRFNRDKIKLKPNPHKKNNRNAHEPQVIRES